MGFTVRLVRQCDCTFGIVVPNHVVTKVDVFTALGSHFIFGEFDCDCVVFLKSDWGLHFDSDLFQDHHDPMRLRLGCQRGRGTLPRLTTVTALLVAAYTCS